MSMDKYSHILERLAQARTHAGLSQSQAAKLMGFESASTISHYESGLRKVDLETFIKLAEIYDVSEVWLLTGHNPDFDEQRWLQLMQNTSIAMEDLDKLMETMKMLRQDMPTG